ncbi:hypothetical protein [Spirobacillus cienkowskii]|uniref:hypothetical protein n=1 Tax=Spirobacillus cienkowskii TaxID=495820 RepID=UPI0030D280BF
MNKKNNLGKISIPFSLLSILLASCGKNTSIPEATYQKSKASFNLNVAPSANYEAQPDAQTIIIPESGCVILNSFANINNIKKQLNFDNINLYSSALENFQLNVKDQSLCHTTTLIPNKTDLAELVLKIGDEVSETFNIKVQSYPLPPIILNSFTNEVKNNIYNFSVNINNKNQPLNPKLYNIKFLSDKGSTIAFVPDESFEIRDYKDNKIGTVHNLDDGTTQFTINNSFDHQIHSIVIGHKFSVVANRYIINTKEKLLVHVNTDSFFENEISTRESVFNDKIKELKELFNAQIKNISEALARYVTDTADKIDTLKTTLSNLINAKFNALSQEFAIFKTTLENLDQFVRTEIVSMKANISLALSRINSLNLQVADLQIKDAELNTRITNTVTELRNKFSELDNRVTKNESAIINLSNTELRQINDKITELNTIINGTNGLNTLINQLKNEFQSDSSKTAQIQTLQQRIDNIESQLSSLNNNINSFILKKTEIYKETLQAILRGKENIKPVIDALDKLNTNTIKTNLRVITAQLDSLINNNDTASDIERLDEDQILSVTEINDSLKELNDIINPTL